MGTPYAAWPPVLSVFENRAKMFAYFCLSSHGTRSIMPTVGSHKPLMGQHHVLRRGSAWLQVVLSLMLPAPDLTPKSPWLHDRKHPCWYSVWSLKNSGDRACLTESVEPVSAFTRSVPSLSFTGSTLKIVYPVPEHLFICDQDTERCFPQPSGKS